MNIAFLRLQPLRIGLLLLVLALCLGGCAVSSAQIVRTDDDHHVYRNFPCGPADRVWSPAPSNDYLSWTPNGEHIVFTYFKGGRGQPEKVSSLYVVDVHGSRLRLIVDASPAIWNYGMPYGLHADTSPDGARIVYTSCEFPKAGTRQDSGDELTLADFNYEIAVINLDGSAQQRLTENQFLDQFPVWSPDGSRIAFVADFAINRPLHHSNSGMIFTLAADGADVRQLGSPGVRDVAYAPPLWSPDGEYLAYITRGNESFNLNTIRAGGAGERTRIGRVLGAQTRPLKYYMPPPVPSWSPDGKYLAFATAAEESESSTESTVYTVRPDGSEQRKLLDVPGNVSHVLWSPSGEYIATFAWIWNGGDDSAYFLYIARSDGTEVGYHSWGQFLGPWIYLPRISWSPTRAELLVNDDADFQAFLIQVDYDEVQTKSLGFVQHTALAAWSPDGERIAFFTPHISSLGDRLLWTVARDGTEIDRRYIVNIDQDGNLVPANPPE